MNGLLVIGVACELVAILAVCWLGWQLLRQNGRLLLRVEDLEERLNELEFGEHKVDSNPKSEVGSEKSDDDQSLVTSAATNGDGGANRFSNRSVTASKIKRDGLKAGTPAPDFRLPRLDGKGGLGLSDLRGKRVILVFSSPDCGPCNTLAPELERFHRNHPETELVMISKGEPQENRAKVQEHGLTFRIVLQRQWEISRRYAMFATPVAYLIDETGIIERDVAVGVEPVLALLWPCLDLVDRE